MFTIMFYFVLLVVCSAMLLGAGFVALSIALNLAIKRGILADYDEDDGAGS